MCGQRRPALQACNRQWPYLLDACLAQVVHIAVPNSCHPCSRRPRGCCAAGSSARGAALCTACRRAAAAGGGGGRMGCCISGCRCPRQAKQLLLGASNSQRQQLRVHGRQHGQLVAEEEHRGAAATGVCGEGSQASGSCPGLLVFRRTASRGGTLQAHAAPGSRTATARWCAAAQSYTTRPTCDRQRRVREQRAAGLQAGISLKKVQAAVRQLVPGGIPVQHRQLGVPAGSGHNVGMVL